MSLDQIIVIIVSFIAMIFTYWFFLGKKDKEILVFDEVEIIVDGGYKPEVISISKNKKTKLNFIRRDPNTCLEEVVLGDFKIRKQLPLNKKISVEILPKENGEFTYSCGMGMYHGKIIVK